MDERQVVSGGADDADDDRIQDYSHVTPGYRRALWTVVLLNVGYGAVEIVAGLMSGSQALMADSLDFLGDGTITLMGLIAIGWSLAWRARAALLQGLFLGALGVGVVASSIYRVFVLYQPEAGTMGLFGGIALAINVISALVLLPHRKGDANVRAVWLFSRNDALGNVAVIAAAGLVAWTGTRWPDLAVAVVVAGLFLQSSVSIVRHARSDLHQAKAAASP
ncbi:MULTISPECIES: cation diffusion facilitator family transporter [Azospirillum]|uniref:Cation transporter n=1 Tax=Azospirillum brasilense TaxID=192 RepID=A0A6L3B1D6_AZOBR|nr:cation diffusion facilitator family transporter [Azospirillum brasilense]KAA0686132.1 cation transporter [Azospirillum brasilense]